MKLLAESCKELIRQLAESSTKPMRSKDSEGRGDRSAVYGLDDPAAIIGHGN